MRYIYEHKEYIKKLKLRLKSFGIDIYKHGQYHFFTLRGLKFMLYRAYINIYFWCATDKHGRRISSKNINDLNRMFNKLGV